MKRKGSRYVVPFYLLISACFRDKRREQVMLPNLFTLS